MGSKTRLVSDVLLWFFVLSLFIPLEFEFGAVTSLIDYKITLVDLSLLLMCGFILYQCLVLGQITLTLPKLTALFTIAAFWIYLSLFVATLTLTDHFPLVSTLWSLKYLEAIVGFILLQALIPQTSLSVELPIRIAALIVIPAQLIVYILNTGPYRAAFIGMNPNTMAVVLSFLVLYFSAQFICINDDRVLPLSLSLGGIAAIISTGSRSGLITVTVGFAVLYIQRRELITKRTKILSGVSFIILSIASLFLFQKMVERLFGWIKLTNKGLSIASTGSGIAIRARIRHIHEAIQLIQARPFFGHGWFASPSRVPWIDIHYFTLAVELGIPGLLLVVGIYLFISADLYSYDRSIKSPLSGASLSWFVGLLFGSLGGGFLRIPHILLLVLLIVTLLSYIWQNSYLPRTEGENYGL